MKQAMPCLLNTKTKLSNRQNNFLQSKNVIYFGVCNKIYGTMQKSNFSVAMAHLVMESVADLQKKKMSASLRDIKTNIAEKYGEKAEKYLEMVPQYVRKGMNVGIISKYGDNYRTKMYVAKRGRRRRRSKSRGRKGGRRHALSVTIVEGRRRRKKSKSRRRRRHH